MLANEPTCLEANKKIKITLLFLPDDDPQSQDRSILIDSVSYNIKRIPRINKDVS